MSDIPVLKMIHVSKEYYGNKVLKDISLDVMPGEVHALVGENGAGKSTLMNILFGMPVIHQSGGYKGEIQIDGQKVDILSPNDALKHGIGMVHQEFMLIPGFTIAENIKLNREPLKENFAGKFNKSLRTLDRVKMNEDAKAAIDQLGLDVDATTRVGGLPIGYMQFIEIAREIDKSGVRLLVFDEPTAVLTESEADKLLAAMQKLSEKGIGILFITHRLDEVMASSRRITIVRDGELIKTMNTAEADVANIAQLMVGREIEKLDRLKKPDENAEIVMSIENMSVNMPGERVRGVNLNIRKGEILGIGGLAGQGKIGIANGIMGLYSSTGKVTFQGKEVKLNKPTAAIDAGLGFVSEDRRGVGLLIGDSIEMNMVVPAIQNKGSFLKRFLLFTQKDKKAISANAEKYIKELDIRCISAQQPVQRLSGGNQQKVCIAKALTMDPKMLFVSEPTRGIDIGAKRLVLDTLIKLNEEYGLTIVITSSELAELRSICDRIAIVTDAKVAGILAADDSDVNFGLLMSGIDIEKSGVSA